MFTKKQYLDILIWSLDYIQKHPNIYLLQQVPVTGVIDYSVGDLVRAVKKFRGEVEVVRAYEKIFELISVRIMMHPELEVQIKNKLLGDIMIDTKLEEVMEVEKRLTDIELEKKMKELGWMRVVDRGKNG